MKSKLTQISGFLYNIDLRTIRLVAFVLMLGVGLLMKGPSDGGTGPV